MFAMMALSMAFWSSARVAWTTFFCRGVLVAVRVLFACLLACLSLVVRCFPPASGTYLGLLSLLEERLLAGLLLRLLCGEVVRCRDLLDLLGVHAGQVDLLGCRNDVLGVHSPQRHAVDLEGAGDQEQALVERLKENDTLAAEAASNEDEDRAGLEGLARGPRADGLADLYGREDALAHRFSAVNSSSCQPSPRAQCLRLGSLTAPTECRRWPPPVPSSGASPTDGQGRPSAQPALLFVCLISLPPTTDLLRLCVLFCGVPLLGPLGEVRHRPGGLAKLLRRGCRRHVGKIWTEKSG